MASQITKPPTAPQDHGLMSDAEFTVLQKYRPEEERWQLIDGVPFMMTPATNRHQRFCVGLASIINDGLDHQRPDLHAFTERGLLVPGFANFKPIADVAVLLNGDGPSYNNRFFLAAEVLSPSNTEEYIALKCQRYMQHPDNLHVLVVSQDERRVDHWARSNGWKKQTFKSLKSAIDLPEFDCRFTLAQLYKGTPLAT
jgi:Uma2 family endonuclease